ncbi:hypothetical protein AB1484_26905 [Parafrankia sp. FMc6]|uniref:hypothetical protein n=1 Tax=Parafrankia soli TaxID=2599596 RepID=UPI0034D6D1B6
MPIPAGQSLPPGVYATPADLTAYTGATSPPDNALVQLRGASLLIRHMTREAIYAVDTTGRPTDSAVAAAMRDATCAQAAYWAETGDPQGAQAGYQTVAIGRVSMTRATTGGEGRSPGGRLAPDARLILANAQLIP